MKTFVLVTRAPATLAALLAFGVLLGAAGAACAAEDPTPALFVSPTGSDRGRCTRAAPCASFQRAYALARPGDIVQMAGGTYSRQVIEFRSDLRNTPCSTSNSSKCITFAPARGATVAVNGNVEIMGSGVRLKGTANRVGGTPTRDRTYNIRISGVVTVEAESDAAWPDHVIVEGVDAANFAVGGADYVTLRDMDAGPTTVDWASGCTGTENVIGANGASRHEARNVILDRVVVHNQNRTLTAAQNDCHTGGLFLITGSNITIRNSLFSQNVVYNIIIQNFGDRSPPSQVTFENNWFGCPVENLYTPNGETTCNGQDDIQFAAASPFRNILIRYNSLGGGVGEYVPGASYENVRVVGNVGGGSGSCLSGAVYAFNAWVGGRTCAPSDVLLQGWPFVALTPGKENFTLSRGTRASELVAGSGRDFRLATDIAGRLRPVRFPSDAGASQRETAAIVLGRSIGQARLGLNRAIAQTTYGAPRKVRKGKLGEKNARVRTDSYRVAGGSLHVISHEGKIVGLVTASRYYSTPSGIGPGASAGGKLTLAGARWLECARAYRRTVRGVAVHLQANAKRQMLTGIAMYARGYEPACKG